MSPATILEEYVAMKSGIIGDVNSIFIPYIVFLIDQNKYYSLDDFDKILADFKEMYKFSLDELVFRKLLVEINEEEYVYLHPSEKFYVSNTYKIQTHRFQTYYKEVLESFDNLKQKCNQYLFAEMGMPVPTEDELVDAVLYLIQNICNTATFSEDIAIISSGNTAYRAALNDFVLYAEKNYPEIVDELNKLAVSDILWRVISSADKHDVNFRNGAKIFLDTRFVLRLMGFEGEYWERLYKTLSSQITERGGTLILFDHVKEEIVQIIRSAQNMCNSEYFDVTKASRVAKEIYSNPEKYTDTYISELLYNLLYNSEFEYNFAIERYEYKVDTNIFQIDSNELKDRIIQEYRQTDQYFDEYKADNSIEIDIRSITMCKRIQGDFFTDRVDDITVIFLTTNKALLRALVKIGIDKPADGKIPIGMTAEYLSTFLSLGKKIDYLETNRVLMLAYCYGAIQPTKSQISSFVQALETESKAKRYSKDKVSYLKQSRTLQRLYTINSQLPSTQRKTFEEFRTCKNESAHF